MGSTCFNWFCDRTIVKPIMCEESLSSLFFACNCEAQAIAPLLERQERQGNPPKGFSRSDKCLPVSGIFRRKTDG